MQLLSRLFRRNADRSGLNYITAIQNVQMIVDCAKSPLEKVRAYNYAMFVIRTDYAAYSKTLLFRRNGRYSAQQMFPYTFQMEDGTVLTIPEEKRTIPVNLNKHGSIVVSAWNHKRMADILPVVYSKGFSADDNHKAIYYSDINIAVVYSGNHSISAGVFYGSGSINARLFDVSKLYDHLDTDGVHWINRHTNRIISNTPSEHIAILYEISRRKKRLLAGLPSEEADYCRMNADEFMKSTKFFNVVCGMPCAGKSSFIGAMDRQTLCAAYTDDNTGLDAFASLLDKCENIVEESQIISCGTLDKANMAKKKGYFIRMNFIGLTDPDECVRRSEIRSRKCVTPIQSRDFILSVINGFPDRIIKLLKLCDTADFFDNENGFEHIAHWNGQAFSFPSAKIPEWFYRIHSQWLLSLTCK